MFDLLIRGAEVADGSGRSRFQADIGVRDGKIASVGKLADAQARQTIDAAGKIVAPGFIDVHNHSDGWLLVQPHLWAKTSQGFTTEVLMADGISYAPTTAEDAPQWIHYLRSLNGLKQSDYDGWLSLTDYAARLDKANVQNFALHIPYANLRVLQTGWSRAAVDDFQMRSIRADIAAEMANGAVGLSTGLDYISQCFATTDELVEACVPVAQAGGLYVTHVRYKKGLLPAVAEAVEIGERSGVKIHVSHLKSLDPREVEALLKYIDTTASHRCDFSFDVYPYQPSSTMLNYLLPYEIWERGPLAAVDALRDPAVKRRFADGLAAYRLPLGRLRIAWCQDSGYTDYHGRTLEDVVNEAGLPPEETLLRMLIDNNLSVLLVLEDGDDRHVYPMLKHSKCILGTDGIYHAGGQIHPRVYGSAGRLIGPLVRDAKLFSLEDAVARLTSRPAERFGLVDRGVIAEGKVADLVVFDADEVSDMATYSDPHQTCSGIETVVVNGQVVVRNGEPAEISGELPGRWLKAEFAKK
jgi:N-acyl-D-amino-acid deacylase